MKSRIRHTIKSFDRPSARLAHRAARDLLRDPALWAWLVVALLAILPARAVLAG